MGNEEIKASTITFKVGNKSTVEESEKIYPNKDKKKKKFVYLDKYDVYKEAVDQRIESIEKSVNIGYVGMGVLALWLLLITLSK